MTKRKRPRYGTPSRQAEEDARRGYSRPVSQVRYLSPDQLASFDGDAGFNQLARPHCDECGSPVEWLTGEQATARGIDLAGALEFLGVDAIPGPGVWACTSCDKFGVMGPSEAGS